MEERDAFDLAIRWIDCCCLCQSQDNGGRCGFPVLVPGKCADCMKLSRLGADGSELRTEMCNWLSIGASATRECDVVSQ